MNNYIKVVGPINHKIRKIFISDFNLASDLTPFVLTQVNFMTAFDKKIPLNKLKSGCDLL